MNIYRDATCRRPAVRACEMEEDGAATSSHPWADVEVQHKHDVVDALLQPHTLMIVADRSGSALIVREGTWVVAPSVRWFKGAQKCWRPRSREAIRAEVTCTYRHDGSWGATIAFALNASDPSSADDAGNMEAACCQVSARTRGAGRRPDQTKVGEASWAVTFVAGFQTHAGHDSARTAF